MQLLHRLVCRQASQLDKIIVKEKLGLLLETHLVMTKLNRRSFIRIELKNQKYFK